MKNLAFLFILFTFSTLAFAQLAGDISLADANAQFVGENAGDLAGHHVAIIGDLDDDGYDEFVVTAPERDLNESTANNGAVYLFYGRASGFSGDIDIGTADAIFTGELPGQEAAHDVFGLGDIDNDGFDDFGIGLKKHNTVDDSTKGGKIYLFFGGAPRFSGQASLETAEASIVGTRAFAEAAHIMPAGDLDADGYADFIVGAGFHSQIGTEAGKVYIFFGKDRDQWDVDVSMEEAADASYLAEAAGDWAAHRVAGVGDINGDGRSDFIVGAHNADTGELVNNGKVYLILGKDRADWHKDVSLSLADASWTGQNKQGLGWNVATVGDVDGDGHPDMLFAQKKNNLFLLLAKSVVLAQDQAIETTADVVFAHNDVVWDEIGHDNSTLGDINADGIDDFIIGASTVNDSDIGDGTGKAYIFWGRSAWPSSMPIDDADAILTGENAGDAAGFSTSGTGDINNDGINDVLISAVKNDDNGIDAGKTYLFLNPSPSLTLLSPNGGETYHPGESTNILWLTDPEVDNVKLELSTDNGQNWALVADNVADTGSYSWTIPDSSSDSCLVRIADAFDGDPVDVSNSPFSISAEAFIRLLAPNGGESLAAGSSFDIEWTSQHVTEHIKIELSVDNGATWDVVAADEANDGLFTWTVPNRASTQCLVRLSASPASDVIDISDGLFTITGDDYDLHRIEAEDAILSDGYVAEDRDECSNGQVARLTNSASNGTIKYNFALVPGEYQLYVRYSDEIDGTCQSVLKIEGRTVDEWQWDVAVSNDVYVYRRIGVFTFNFGDEISLWTLRDNGEYARVDYFEFKSTGLPSDYMAVMEPNGGENWFLGATHNIAWTSFATSGAVNIEISRDNGATWNEIASNVPDDGIGAYAWEVTGPTSQTCLIRVSDIDGSPLDVSDAVFTIMEQVTPTITVTSPNGGETWLVGTSHPIVWTSEHTTGIVKIEISRNEGGTWEMLAANTPDDGSFDWTVTEPTSEASLIRVSDVAGTTADSSDTVFTIAKPSITVVSPNGDETWDIGTTQQIIWRPEYISGTVKVEISRDGGASWQLLAENLNITPNQEGNAQMSWAVIGPESENCYIKVSATDGSTSDMSDDAFIITSPPAISVISPNGGQVWRIGESHDITWTSNKISGDVKVELSRDNGTSFSTLTEATPNDGVLEWTVSGPTSERCLVKISSAAAGVSDVSDTAFSIIETPEITVTSPNGGETWTIGTMEKITWTSVSGSGEVNIEVSRDGGAAWESIVETTADDGEYDWTVTLPASENCVIRVADAAGLALDHSDGLFTIKNPPQPIITVIQPNGSEKWHIGTEQILKWFSKDIESAVAVELSRDGGAVWESIIDSANVLVDNSGMSQLSWTVSGPASDNCLVRIRALDGSALDASDAAFTISEKPGITLTAPNGSEKWQIGKTYNITWQSVNVGDVRIEISVNGGAMWTDIISRSPNTGTFAWLVTGQPSDSALVRLTALDGSASDTSDALFAIVPAPALVVDTPNGGESLQIGQDFAIAWNSQNTSGWVDIELTRDNGVTWEALADSTKDDGSFLWTISGPASNTCLVRIADVTGAPLDISDAHFSIVEQPSLTVLAPAADDLWLVGSEQTILWEAVNTGSTLKITLSRDGGTSWEMLSESVANTGSWSWTVQQPISENCFIRIEDPQTGVQAENDGAFVIKYPTGVARISSEIPDEFALLQNYPNPFNPETRISYQLAEQADVLLQVYSIKGALVATLVNESQPAGSYLLTWAGSERCRRGHALRCLLLSDQR